MMDDDDDDDDDVFLFCSGVGSFCFLSFLLFVLWENLVNDDV